MEVEQDERAAERRAFAEIVPRIDVERWPRLYEEFLARARPGARHGHGVYFTPAAVVQAQVRLVEQVLRQRLDCPEGFADARVEVVDPAVGAGAYPLKVLQGVSEAAASGVRERMRLFEALPGAAALARARGLPVEERDALRVELASSASIVVCLGNPPYRRHAASADARQALAGFCDARGVHRKNLYNEYVYFWRWALREVLERRRGAGIVCFVSAASYLHGPAFEGMRRSLRQAFDELWLIDLEGDQRAARASHNVFPIRTPVAIGLGVRYAAGDKSNEAVTHYARLAGSAAHKLSALEAIHTVDDLKWESVGEGWGTPLVRTQHGAYAKWPALTELFPWQVAGAQLKRTWPIAPTPVVLRERWRALLELGPDERASAFGASRDRDVDSSPPDLFEPARRLAPLRGLHAGAEPVEPVRYAYRAFDRQWVLPDTRCGDFMRPRLWRSSGPRQVYLTTMLTNVMGPGPGAVATTLVPDLDHFRGSFGARGVIPLWLDAEATQPNVDRGWLGCLSERYGCEVTPPMVLGYCYALLSCLAYTRRFAEELRTPGPRVPLTHDPALFRRAARSGERLLALHTFGHISPGCAQVVQDVTQALPTAFRFDPAREALTVGDGQFGPISREIWDFAVSGYPILAGWLRRRIRRPPRSILEARVPVCWDPRLSTELLEVVWLIEATLDAQPELDGLLQEAASGSSFERALAQAL